MKKDTYNKTTRTCHRCKQIYLGGTTAKYCYTCREEIRQEHARDLHARRAIRARQNAKNVSRGSSRTRRNEQGGT